MNARAETLETKPTFRPLLERRCLVPATAYFEWKNARFQAKWSSGSPPGKRADSLNEAFSGAKPLHTFAENASGRDKIKTRIHANDNGIIAFAGLIGDGRFTIVTCAPAPAIAHVHDRMPVILGREQQVLWLDETKTFGAVKHVLAPYGDLAADEVPGARPRQSQFAF
ncbi:MAG: SOS response-associated peptidase family protein [Rhodospirillaceae bacterium]|nr:SOS response-associated peptidase family protein [Rhodospirillaceae bacterium]